MQKRFFFLMAMMLTFSLTMIAQVTTSSMAGKVTTADTEEAVIGATIQAVHVPSGTRYVGITNVNGRFTIQGMRTGGPYEVTVSYIGYQDKKLKGISLQLGETYDLDVWLAEDANELAEVVITARASKFAAERTGASTNINNATIMELPTISRSISDIARLSPYANGMGFAGGDGRSTNFTLDGANMNNNFGLSSSLPGGGTPVSMDAIEEVQVVVAPFDVRQTNFIGGGINAVTKSGTNTFKGTAYVYHFNENMHGNRVDNLTMADPGTDRQTTYGFTLGGPIIKDKLFFFANFERSDIPSTPNRWRASEDGVSDPKMNISRTRLADMETVRNFLLTNYNYDPGSYTSFPADEGNTKYLARLDWNINTSHKLAIRFNHTENSRWNTPSGTSNDVGHNFTYGVQDRASAYSMIFANAMYNQKNKITTISADLNSRFSNYFSNQLLFTYSNIDDVRDSNSDAFPFVEILTHNDAGKLEPYMTFGNELFTWKNRVQNKVTTITDNATFYLGTHKVTAGINFEHQLTYNAYMRNGTGYYSYNSLEDFLSGAAPEGVALTWGYNGNTDPRVQVSFNQWGFYLQDEWNITKKFKLSYGIRFDQLIFNDDDLMRNNAIYNLDFEGRHIDTGKWPDSNLQISPRVGFVWDVLGDKTLKVRGGTGLFAGRIPQVFFTNMPTNSGMTQYQYNTSQKSEGNLAVLQAFQGGMVTDMNRMRDIIVATDPTAKATITPQEGAVPSSIAAVDPKFKMPQVWKTSLAIDYSLPTSFPLSLTGEFTYTRKINDILLDDYNMKSDYSTWARMAGADNRILYPSDYRIGRSSAYVLTNTSKGHGWTANVTLNAEPIENMHIMAAYTHTVMKEVSGMIGSNASSVWKGMYTINGPKFPDVQNSTYVIPDRVIVNFNYKYGKEHFSLFYTGYSPSGYSYFYGTDINGDGLAYDLMYIPRDDSEIKFASDEDRVAFWNFVEQDDYLKSHKGEYAEAYAARAPWVHRFDFRWAHDFDLKIGNTTHKLQLSADVQNIGNLFSSRWGVMKNMANTANGGVLLSVTNINDVKNGAQPIFRMNTNSDGSAITKTWDYNHAYGQCWRLQVGVKYFFN